jgi:hypothetical protein
MSDDELDATRIARLAKLRRSAYRSRSWCVIAAIAGFIAALQSLADAVGLIRQHAAFLRISLLMLLFAALLIAAYIFTRLAFKFHHEIKLPQPEPKLPQPDFSQLGDGSQRARNLENID